MPARAPSGFWVVPWSVGRWRRGAFRAAEPGRQGGWAGGPPPCGLLIPWSVALAGWSAVRCAECGRAVMAGAQSWRAFARQRREASADRLPPGVPWESPAPYPALWRGPVLLRAWGQSRIVASMVRRRARRTGVHLGPCPMLHRHFPTRPGSELDGGFDSQPSCRPDVFILGMLAWDTGNQPQNRNNRNNRTHPSGWCGGGGWCDGWGSGPAGGHPATAASMAKRRRNGSENRA